MADRQQLTASEFDDSTRRYIRRHGLLHPGAPVIVAFSGGADSMALLASLHSLGYECVAAHCNFHLRGQESNRDMQHARKAAAAMGVDIAIRHFNIDGEPGAMAGESTEMACRRLRYRWFDDLADSCGAQAIAVGHHSEDRAETFVLNLLRGAGIVGLTSMNARAGAVVRPLLWATRAQITGYLASRGLGYVDDSSNFTCDFARNRIRNVVLPGLERQFPGAGQSVLRSIANLESVRRVFLHLVEQARAECTGADGSISLALLSRYPEPATMLHELLRGKGFTPTQTAAMADSATAPGSRFISTTGMVAEVDRDALRILDGAPAADLSETQVSLARDITAPARIHVSRHRVEEFAPPARDPGVIFLDMDFALDPGARWTLRHWRQGDRMTPFGASASKLLSDIFTDARLGAAHKRSVWLLLRDGQIVWAVGLRPSALGTVGPRSRGYVRLEYAGDTPAGRTGETQMT